jgi:serine/threonine-protein kinase
VVSIGTTLGGKYLLRRLIGDGGMGSVYEAEHVKLGTRVAIKVLHADLARRAGLIDRFLREARVAAQIKSAHVVHVTDVDQTPDGVAYLVMDLLEGEPLSSLLERERKVPVPLACEYTRQILEALEAAHALGVIHRDLKPENVFITYEAGKPVLKLIDFGIAKLKRTDGGANLTVAGIMMGTAEYMPPEQAFSADRVDARADLYSVGVMLFEMIAGVRPVSGEDARVIAMKVERGEVTPLVHAAPDVPREIAGLVHRAMAFNPDLRFASATEMRLALEGALAGKRPPTAPLPPAAVVSPAGSLEGAAGTGTVLGAPVEAAWRPMTGVNIAFDPTARAPRPGPSPASPVTVAPRYDEHPSHRPPGREEKRGGRGALWLLVAVVVLGGAGAGGYYVYDAYYAGPTPTSTATTTGTSTTTATTTATSTAPATSTGGPLSPLTPATVTTPATPTRPSASTQPTAHPTTTPSGGATTEPVPPLPTITIPPQFLNDAGVLTIPTTLPPGLPSFPIPFPPPPAPSTTQ